MTRSTSSSVIMRGPPGRFLTMIGLALLLRATRDPAHANRLLLAAGSVSLAAAAGTRPHLAVAVAYIVLTAFVLVRSRRGPASSGGVTGDLLALVGPYLLIGALLGAYNVARFGSVTEFGTQYQLSLWNMRDYPLMKPSYIWPNIRDYVVALPRLEAKPPFVFLLDGTPVGTAQNPTRHFREPVAGVLALYPVIPAGLVVLAANARRIWRQCRPLAVLLGLSLALVPIVLLAMALPFNASTMRYTVDFAPMLILVASVGWGWSFAQYRDRLTLRRVLATCWVAAVGLSILIAFLLILTPCTRNGSC